MVLLCMFCFNQKTAYEMRMSDWSSDVCSSDLTSLLLMHRARKVDDRFVLSFTVAAGFGDVVPFLAEGDRVEMAVQLFEDSPIGREPLVYALRNFEDDFAYVSQAIFLRGFNFRYGAR